MPKKPNIIIFNPDQWRGDVMGHLGNPAAVTPFLDRLVSSDAVSFRHAYCQNPVCTPSRCSFMTGWYPHVRGHRSMHHMLHHEHGETNLLRELKKNGYTVWWGGKNDFVPGDSDFYEHCHVRHRPDRAALKARGITLQRNTHATAAEWRGSKDDDNFYSFFCGRLGGEEPETYWDNDWDYVHAAMDFIRDYRGEQPFCLYLPLQYPHPPYAVEEPYFSCIDRQKLPPRIPGIDDPAKPCLLKGIRDRQGLHNWPEERWDELRATYYGMCARLDRQFELLVNTLKEHGYYDDSALFLFADHGDFTGDYGLVEKTQNTFEDCLTRVPLIVKMPKDQPQTPGIRDGLVELIDFTETVYDLCQIDPGYDRFGHSLLASIADPNVSLRDAVFCEGGRRMGELQAAETESSSAHDPDGLYWPRCSLQVRDDMPWHGKAVMCRTATFKYVYRLYEEDEFYDLNKDPDELHNAIYELAYREQINLLRERTLRWLVETADVMPRKTDPR
jgi:arylsulfatase A-like enzyme